jgi:hypothetical protein
MDEPNLLAAIRPAPTIEYERLGSFVKRGIIDEDLACDRWSAQAVGDWVIMEPSLSIVRRSQDNAVFENFEYFVGELSLARGRPRAQRLLTRIHQIDLNKKRLSLDSP